MHFTFFYIFNIIITLDFSFNLQKTGEKVKTSKLLKFFILLFYYFRLKKNFGMFSCCFCSPKHLFFISFSLWFSFFPIQKLFSSGFCGLRGLPNLRIRIYNNILFDIPFSLWVFNYCNITSLCVFFCEIFNPLFGVPFSYGNGLY